MIEGLVLAPAGGGRRDVRAAGRRGGGRGRAMAARRMTARIVADDDRGSPRGGRSRSSGPAASSRSRRTPSTGSRCAGDRRRHRAAVPRQAATARQGDHAAAGRRRPGGIDRGPDPRRRPRSRSACWPGGLTVVVRAATGRAVARGADRRGADDRAARAGSRRAPGARRRASGRCRRPRPTSRASRRPATRPRSRPCSATRSTSSSTAARPTAVRRRRSWTARASVPRILRAGAVTRERVAAILAAVGGTPGAGRGLGRPARAAASQPLRPRASTGHVSTTRPPWAMTYVVDEVDDRADVVRRDPDDRPDRPGDRRPSGSSTIPWWSLTRPITASG